MKNITFRTDENLIAAARERAGAEHTTLNEQFRRWLADYAQAQKLPQRYDEVMATLRGKLMVRRRLTRNEMHER